MESGFPPDIPIEELSNARENAQIEQILMNAFDGELLLGMNPFFLSLVCEVGSLFDQAKAI